jgi:PAS domain S-box-containing protein
LIHAQNHLVMQINKTLPIFLCIIAQILSSALYAQNPADIGLTQQEKEWLVKHPVISVAPDPDFPPIEWFDNNGKFTGIAADYVSLVQKQLGITFKIVRCSSWDEVLLKVRNKEVDMLSAAAQTPQREEYLLFSEPHVILPGVIITRKEVRDNITLQDLKGMKVAIVSGYVWQEFISRDHPAIKLDPVHDVQTGLRKASFGIDDAMIENLATATTCIEKEGITNLKVAGETGYYTRLSFAIRNDWPELRSVLDKALASINEDTKKQIYQQWIHIHRQPLLPGRIFWIILAGVIIVIISILAWNRLLTRRVGERTYKLTETVRRLESEVSERQHAEAALKESEQKFLEMVENANSAIIRMDTKGNVTFFNKFAQEFFGFAREEILGKNIIDTIVPNTETSGRDLAALMDNLYAHPGRYARNENENIRKNGDRVWISWTNKPILDKQGNLAELLCVGNDITYLKAAAAALKSERDFATAIFETAGALSLVFDKEGNIVRFNRTCEAVTGYNSSEVIGKQIWEIFLVPEETAMVKARFQALRSGNFPNSGENYWRTKTGNLVFVSWFNTAICDDCGNVTFIVSTGIDITERRRIEKELEQHRLRLEEIVKERTAELSETIGNLQKEIGERKRAEDALRASERNYREIYNATNEAIFIHDASTVTILDVNQTMCEMFGFTREEASHLTVGEFSSGEPPYTNASAKEWVARAFTVGPQLFEWRAKRKNGELFWIETNLKRATINGNECIIAVVRDISERKRGEMALSESERRYRFLFDGSPAGSVIIGPNGILVDINKSFEQSLGYGRDEIIGRSAADFIAAYDRARVMGVLQKRIAGEIISEEIDTPVLAKDGSVRFINFAGGQAQLFDRESFIGILITGVDVTERRKAEELARQQEQKLIQADKMATLGVLVSGVAHEINNPNNFIILNSDNLADIWKDIKPILQKYREQHGDFMLAGLHFDEIQEEVQPLISGISKGANRIRNIVQNLKDFARHEPGDMNQMVPINAVVDAATQILGSLIKKSTDRFSFINGEGIPSVKGAFQKIEQVVINLISNACQVLTSKNQAVSVATTYVRERGRVIITVTDEGAGISPENLKHIMTPFFTTKRDSGGTGLGLAISYNIIKDHGGELSFESELGKGTIASVSLPAAE